MPLLVKDANGQIVQISTPDEISALTTAALAQVLAAITAQATALQAQPVSGSVAVSNLPGVQPISATSLPLSAGASTETKQDTGNTSLASILAKLTADPATQTTLAAVLAKLIAAPATEAKQDTGNTSLASILAKLTADPATQATLAAVLAKLIAAPATEAKQDTGNTSLASILAKLTADPATQATLAAVLSALQGKLAIGAADLTASGNITIINSVPAGVATAGSAVELVLADGACALSVQVTGSYTGALSLQGTIDGTAWITIGGTVFFNVNTGVAAATIASATQGIFQGECSGFAKVRLTALAAVTGTAAVTLRASKTASIVALDSTATVAFAAAQAVTQSGTWTAQIGNTPNTTPILNSGCPSTSATAACTVSAQAAIATPNLKASAGSVYGVSIYNPNAAVVYLQFYNTASAPTRGTSVVWWLAIPASGTLTIPPGASAIANFATGIGAACATTSTGATAPTTAPDVVVFYK